MMEAMIPSIFSTALNFIAAKSNQLNQAKIAKANLQQQDRLTHEQWANDAAAFQTGVEDARKAGLSPLAAIDHPTMWSNAIYSDQVAPQFDASGITASLASMTELLKEQEKNAETKRHNLEEEKQAADELEFKTKELKNKNDEASKMIKNQNAKAIYEMESASDRDREKYSWEYISNLQDITGYTFKEKDCSTWTEYLNAQKDFTQVWTEIQAKFADIMEYSSESKNENTTVNGNIGPVGGGGSSSEGYSRTKNEKAAYAKAIEEWKKEQEKNHTIQNIAKLKIGRYTPEPKELKYVE